MHCYGQNIQNYDESNSFQFFIIPYEADLCSLGGIFQKGHIRSSRVWWNVHTFALLSSAVPIYNIMREVYYLHYRMPHWKRERSRLRWHRTHTRQYTALCRTGEGYGAIFENGLMHACGKVPTCCLRCGASHRLDHKCLDHSFRKHLLRGTFATAERLVTLEPSLPIAPCDALKLDAFRLQIVSFLSEILHKKNETTSERKKHHKTAFERKHKGNEEESWLEFLCHQRSFHVSSPASIDSMVTPIGATSRRPISCIDSESHLNVKPRPKIADS